MGRRTHKANGRYIFIPPENKGDAVTRRKSAMYELNSAKKDIARLESIKSEMLEELDGLSKWIKQNDRATNRVTTEDHDALVDQGWTPGDDDQCNVGD